MRKISILVVDDDIAIRKFIRANLEARDYEVAIATNGAEALRILEQKLPDLIILDIMMPELDGFEVCRQVREWSRVPIIMLSARDNELDKVNCLEFGADDYLTKPFGINELIARIKAVLRREQVNEIETEKSIFDMGNLKINFAHRTVLLDGANVDLTATEYQLLSYLAINAGRIITNDQILEKIWGDCYLGDNHILQVNMARLRQKLLDTDKRHRFIQTKPGIGYMMLSKS